MNTNRKVEGKGFFNYSKVGRLKHWCVYSSNKLVEASPEIQKELKQELDKISKQYGGEGQDLTKFPTFNFQDPVIDPIKEK